MNPRFSVGEVCLRPLRVILLLLACGVSGLAQAPDPQDMDVIKVDTSLVTVNVSISDAKGRHVPGLEQKDFIVNDGGKPVRPEFFDREGPSSIVLLIDVSSSMKGDKWESLRKALKKFLLNAPEGSDYTLITFSEQPRVIARSVTSGELWKNFAGLKPYGETALYDALMLGLDALNQIPQRHKALVLLSDGEDNCSHHSLADVREAALARHPTIYTVGMVVRQRDLTPWQPNGRKLLNELAVATGGLIVFPAPFEIHEALEGISVDLRSQYSLSYYPPDVSPGWRSVKVSLVNSPARLTLRYQQHYLIR